MVKHGVFGIFSKTALRIFLISCQNIKLNSAFQPAKTVHEKKKFVQKLFQVKDTLRLNIGWSSSLYLYLAQKCFDFAETFRKSLSHVLRWITVSFRSFDQISFVSAQIIIIEWSFSYNLISCSKMMRFGCKF